MKILKLKLRGAIGIKKGLGVDEVEVDFTAFKAGLIALTGSNGSGKTTIMENLHPYRTMVSRTGSLQSHFFLKDSYRILEFEHEGNNYESKILLDALTGGSEAYLIRNGKPINDGKLTTYDLSIETVLGSPDLFFSSVFSGQKSKGIAELKPADRRKLFYELLSLTAYEQYLEQAKAELKKNEIKLANIEGEISAIDNGETSVGSLEEERENYLEAKIELVNYIDEVKEQIEKTNAGIRKIEIDLGKAEEKVKANDELHSRIETLKNRVTEITDTHNKKVIRYKSDMGDAVQLIEANKKLAADQENIAEKLKSKKELEEQLSVLKEDFAQDRESLNKIENEFSQSNLELAEREKKITDKQYELSSIESEKKAVQGEIKQIQTDSNLIDDVPCETEVGKGCQFLKNAHLNVESLPGLEEKLRELNVQISGLKDSIESMQKKLTTDKNLIHENYEMKCSSVKHKLEVLDSQITETKEKLDAINSRDWELLNNQASEAANKIEMLEEKIESAKKLIDESKSEFDSELQRISEESCELEKKFDAAIIDKIADLNDTLEFKNNQLSDLKNELTSRENRLKFNDEKLAEIEAKLEQQMINDSKIQKLNDSKQAVQNEITDWNFLCKAFDKTGIPVLKLENSGIEITAIANELLSLFENKFRIVFETTSLTKDKKKLKETFNINIVEDDGVCEIANKSGGQQVWLETAIQLAISNVVRKQGKNIQTSFLDEKDGALDLDNAYAYIEMLRRAHDMSGVQNTFIITHRTELLDFIPQQIKLSDGYLSILN